MPKSPRLDRRTWLSAAAATGFHTCIHPSTYAAANDRPRIAVIGCGSRWGWQLANGGKYGVGPDFARFADYAAVCDVDQHRLNAATQLVKQWNGSVPQATIDYGDILQRDDIDAVLVFTPDHWHAKLAIEAMNVGKDVYCEKPMTLTIEEGQQICATARRTNRIVQVGTQQRSDPKFLTAIAMVREGRLGKIRKVTCGIDGGPTSPEVAVANVPKTLDWNRWLGPVQELAYRHLAGAPNETKAWSNNHYEFRWWYEFSGGKLTDWGAHHVDIASWAINRDASSPLTIRPVSVEHPVPLKDGFPTDGNRYNTAKSFHFVAVDHSGVELHIESDQRNGILIEGDEGKVFVNRGTLAGSPVEALHDHPLPEGSVESVFKNKSVLDKSERFDSLAHVQNFFQCISDRSEPISDVHSHHRALTICHLAGIAGRLGREIRWDGESVVGDDVAQTMTRREKRDGFQITESPMASDV